MLTRKPTITYEPWQTRERERFVVHPSEGLRFAGRSDKLAPRTVQHTGWYLTDDGLDEETAYGVVYQLPARKGVERYVAGYSVSCWDAETALIDFGRFFDNETDAALAADSMAENMAEKSREYYRIEYAKNRIDAIGDELRQVRTTTLALLRARRAAGNLTGPIREAVCARLRSLLAERSELFAERERLAATI